MMQSQLNWGQCKPYLFMDSKTPMITIGPHIKRFIFAFTFYTIYGLIILKLLYERNIGWYRISLSVTTYISALFNYFFASMINQGIYNHTRFGVHSEYCNICKLYQPLKTEHCDECGVCIEQLDHHCPWIGKCVGKNNKYLFYAFVLSMFIFQISTILFFARIL